MAFNSNVQPKKKKLPAGKPWVCGCGQQPAYILFCGRCKRGQAKQES